MEGWIAGLCTAVASLTGAVVFLFFEARRARTDEARCLVQLAAIRTEVGVLRRDVKKHRQRAEEFLAEQSVLLREIKEELTTWGHGRPNPGPAARLPAPNQGDQT